MFKINDFSKIKEMGFVESEGDYMCRSKAKGGSKSLFKIYKGSEYIRFSKASYVNEEQMYKIYEWTKKDLIKWCDE